MKDITLKYDVWYKFLKARGWKCLDHYAPPIASHSDGPWIRYISEYVNVVTLDPPYSGEEGVSDPERTEDGPYLLTACYIGKLWIPAEIEESRNHLSIFDDGESIEVYEENFRYCFWKPIDNLHASALMEMKRGNIGG